MDDTIQGIVLQSIRYGDTSLIVKVFTREHGLRSYMVKGAYNRGSGNRAALFQNLHFIQYVEAGKPNKGSLHYLKDVQLSMVYQSVPLVMKKSAILMYVSDVVAYPNPVRMGFNGFVGIKGLVANSLVRITTVDGAFVTQLISEGGQAIWDLTNINGERVEPGVYFIFVSTKQGTDKFATKILIMN